MKPQDKDKIYAEGVLTAEKHDRFLDELEMITRRAGLMGTPEYVWKKFPADEFGPDEMVYLQKFKTMSMSGLYGMVYLGFDEVATHKRMLQVCGLLVRNQLDARIMSRSEVLSKMRYEQRVSGSAILVPNFCPSMSTLDKNAFISKEKSSDYAEYQREAVYDFLLKKMHEGGQVIVSAPSFKAIERAYGSAVADHIDQNFLGVS